MPFPYYQNVHFSVIFNCKIWFNYINCFGHSSYALSVACAGNTKIGKGNEMDLGLLVWSVLIYWTLKKRLPVGLGTTSYWIMFRTNIILGPKIFKSNENKLYQWMITCMPQNIQKGLVCLQYAPVLVFLFIYRLFIDTFRSSDCRTYV
jgi:hypothetical protein